MEWLLAMVAMAMVVALSLAAARSAATESAGGEERDIDEIFAAVDRDSAADLIMLLRRRTEDLIGRRVPVRDIRAAPTARVARIAFSNGDIVLARTRSPGDLVVMAKAMLVTSVTLSELYVTHEGPVLRFAWNYGKSLDVLAVGLDQAD